MSNEFDVDFGGMELTCSPKTELEAKPSILRKLADTYTEHAKLMFIFEGPVAHVDALAARHRRGPGTS